MSKLKLIFVTDIHESEDALDWLLQLAKQNHHALVIGGDITTEGRQPFIEEFLSSIRTIGGNLLIVPGNHDPQYFSVPPGMTLLHGRRVTLNNLVIGGLGGSSFTGSGAPFEYSDDEGRKLLDTIGSVDILVSHCPPYGTPCDLGPDGKYYGSIPVREYVEARKPRLVLSGHVHVARALEKLGGTTIVNPGPLMEGNYAILRVAKEGVSVDFRQQAVMGQRNIEVS